MISEPALDRLAGMFREPDVSGTRYELLSVLGRGGMGVVYLARDTALDREVALKVVDRAASDPGTSAATPRALAGEARILARLEHPGIVPVHDFGELADGRVYYAMKRVRGERLDKWLTPERGIGDRLAVFLRVCDAVAFAHAHGVVHCDLKPENVMVGEFGEVLVLDWGIAQSAVRNPQSAIAGTPPFMAPEQLQPGGTIDPRTDVFALGVMLDSIAIAPPIIAVARKAQSEDPATRYQDVRSLAADINRFLEGRAVAAHRERLVDRAARVWRRYRLPIALVLTYLVIRLLLLWIAKI
jgi:serine/threonine protein kinase